jgi:hypothetical protein
MAGNVNIPDDILETLKRLMSAVPEKLRGDSHTQTVIQLYLKLGGEKLEDSDTDDEYSDFES